MNEKLEIPRTKYHRAVNLACIIMLAGTFIWLIINWQQLPTSFLHIITVSERLTVGAQNMKYYSAQSSLSLCIWALDC